MAGFSGWFACYTAIIPLGIALMLHLKLMYLFRSEAESSHSEMYADKNCFNLIRAV